jgi:hypothetical protein
MNILQSRLYVHAHSVCNLMITQHITHIHNSCSFGNQYQPLHEGNALWHGYWMRTDPSCKNIVFYSSSSKRCPIIFKHSLQWCNSNCSFPVISITTSHVLISKAYKQHYIFYTLLIHLSQEVTRSETCTPTWWTRIFQTCTLWFHTSHSLASMFIYCWCKSCRGTSEISLFFKSLCVNPVKFSRWYLSEVHWTPLL